MAINAELLIELIESTIAARKDVEKTRNDLRRKLEDLSEEIEALDRDEQGSRLSLARRFPNAEAPGNESAPAERAGLFSLGTEFDAQSRSDAVEAAVRTITREQPTASPAEIELFLRERGRDDTRDAIGAALAYLNRTDRVTRVSRGQWQIRQAP
jgi:hypothetical protein